MAALNFHARYADAVAHGTKRTTIRAPRKDGRRPAKVGKPLTLYTGQRTSRCRKLRETTCTALQVIEIVDSTHVRLDGLRLSRRQREVLAHDDGFDSFADLVSVLAEIYGLPFYGYIIRWL